ncbi:nucleoside triphosphate pyrophosphohydrolase [Candidatus Dojkabacteria bacterium]|nr:nucleoside triphosphate pyrophosphohydrolase [Candidatus Dojkabacteria bacterium]
MPLPKLVRDNIPEIIYQNEGKEPVTRILEEDEYIWHLLAKLQEEVKEVVESESGEHRLEELADVMELIKAIAALDGVTLEQIEEIRKAKSLKNGGFDKRILLKEI